MSKLTQKQVNPTQKNLGAFFAKDENPFKRSGQVVRTPPEREEQQEKKSKMAEENPTIAQGETAQIPGSLREDKLNKIELMLKEMMSKMDLNSQEIKQEITDMRRELKEEREIGTRIEGEVIVLKDKIFRLEKKIEFQEEKWERRERERNIVVRGIEENEDENDEETKEKTIRAIEEKLKIKPKINKAYRVGKKRDGWIRPIKASFYELNEKWEITNMRKHLKGTNLYIDEDYSSRVRNTRRKLFQMARKLRDEGKRVQVRYDTIRIENIDYILMEDGNEVVLQEKEKNEVALEKKGRM